MEGMPYDESRKTRGQAESDIRSVLAARMASARRLHDNDFPLWAGPCGEGDLGGVTQSMLVRFFSCRERFRLKYVCGLETHDRWHHTFGYGNMWHTCEEALARGEDWITNLDRHVSELERKYPMQREDINKWHNVCCVQFPVYVAYWSEHPDVQNRTPLLQEQVFDVPYTLPSRRVVRLRGKWDSVDLITEETEGLLGRHRQTTQGIWLQENKTKGEIDKMQVERQLKFDLQTMMYLIALHEWRESSEESKPDEGYPDFPAAQMVGVRYNVVRRPLSGGKGNIKPHSAKQTKTKYTPAETGPEFYARLRRDYLEADPDYWFFRLKVGISARDVEVFRQTCLDPLLEHLCDWYDMTTNQKHWCDQSKSWSYRTPMNYRTPFGVYSALEEGGSTEYDAYMDTGSEAGLRRVYELFPELK